MPINGLLSQRWRTPLHRIYAETQRMSRMAAGPAPASRCPCDPDLCNSVGHAMLIRDGETRGGRRICRVDLLSNAEWAASERRPAMRVKRQNQRFVKTELSPSVSGGPIGSTKNAARLADGMRGPSTKTRTQTQTHGGASDNAPYLEIEGGGFSRSEQVHKQRPVIVPLRTNRAIRTGQCIASLINPSLECR
jgi:hypothetical protein